MEIQDIVFGNEKLHSIIMLYGDIDIFWQKKLLFLKKNLNLL